MRERKFSTTQSIGSTHYWRGIICAALCSLNVAGFEQSALARESSTLETGSVSESEAPSAPSAYVKPRVPSEQEIAKLKQAVEDAPNDAKAHYAYGHALRASGKQIKAVTEYLDATQLDPAYFVSYHELSLSKARPEQLDEAIERLRLLKAHRPNDLLLCVSLSELLEQRDELYPAAKVLSDLVYSNTVPDKYLARLKARIHFLINKNKEEQTAKKIQVEESDADGAPLPLPESSLRRSLSASQLKDAKVMQNFGHAPLLP